MFLKCRCEPPYLVTWRATLTATGDFIRQRGHVSTGVAVDLGADQTTVVAPVVLRRLLFVSHATPEDNSFAEWLASQLAIHGYEVWCDRTQLLGGEKFWNDIGDAIDRHAFRVLFASTLHSNQKAGTLRELKMALDAGPRHGLKDFLVPLKVDQFPFEATDERIRDLNFVRFDESWEAGLHQLLALLDREGAPKSPQAGPACVAEWRQRSLDCRRKHVVKEDHYVSNWFEMTLPDHLFFHRLAGPAKRLKDAAGDMPYPCRMHGDYLATFATAPDVNDALGPLFSVAETLATATESFIDHGNEPLAIAAFDAGNIVTDLVQKAWNATLQARAFCKHELGSGQIAWFFPSGHLEKNRGYFVTKGGKRAYRQLVGNKSKKTPDGSRRPDGFWHYAVSGSPQIHGFARLALHHHVIFTDDGRTPWSSAERMQKARRSVCKQWWNGEWRDRLFAICAALGDENGEFLLDVGSDQAVRIAMSPMSFTSPWSYFEDNESGLDENAEVELVEDQDDEAGDDENA